MNVNTFKNECYVHEGASAGPVRGFKGPKGAQGATFPEWECSVVCPTDGMF